MAAIIQTTNPVLSRYIRNQFLSALKTNPARVLWATPLCKLSKDPAFAPTQDDDTASLAANEADFDGYAAVVPTTVVPVNQGTQAQALVFTAVFQATAPFTTPNAITGYWTDEAGGNMVSAEATNVDNPIGIAAAGDYVLVDGFIPLEYRQPA